MDSRKVVQRAAIAIASLAAAAASGHPNHADPGSQSTIAHLLTEPDHLLALVAAVGLGIWAVRRQFAARDKQRRD